MNIHEYQAKQVLAKYNVPIPKGKMIEKAVDARAAAQEIGGSFWVVKAQIHAGGRGKGGGVKIAKSLDEVEKYTSEISSVESTISDTEKAKEIYLELEKKTFLGQNWLVS